MGWWNDLNLLGALISGAVVATIAWRGPRLLAVKLVAGLILGIVLLVGVSDLLDGQDIQLLPIKLAGLAMIHLVPGGLVGLALGHVLRRASDRGKEKERA
jgi:hypothetical protein